MKPIQSTTDYKFSHALTGPYLPTPGKAPGWPFAGIGHWMIDVNAASENWVRGLREWRTEHLIRIGFDDAIYRRKELQWSQRNFVHALLMVEDRFFYDATTGRYTVDRYLDDLEQRYGGIDSVLIWYIYPNIGVDDRNQFDLIDDLPGGIDGIAKVVDDFHRRGVKVFLPTMPWDNGTRPRTRRDWEIMAEFVKATGADGINGDTYSGVPRAFFDACDAVGRPVVLEPESTAQAGDHILTWNVQSWSKKIPTEVVPVVAKLKWLEPRHIINIENRWSRERNNDLQHAFFNGIGYVAWENVWGIWNGITPRDAETIRRVATLQREFAALLVSAEWTPYEKTLQAGVFASRFPGKGVTLWTVVNRNEYAVDGPQLPVVHAEGTKYYDAWHGTPLSPRVADGRATCAFALEPRGFGAVVALEKGAQLDGLDAFLELMATLARKPLQSFCEQWRPLPQRMTAIDSTKRAAGAPAGMVKIPAGEFDFTVQGIEIEGQTWDGLDVQYPWESSARRFHHHRLKMDAFFIDECPVTNAGFKQFLDATAYRPADARNFLRHWSGQAPRAGWERKPVTWVSLEDARAYAAWAGKRLPHEWEWQYAAQGADGRAYPWGNDWDAARAPAIVLDREMPAPDDVDAHPGGASPFGVLDLVGNVWQWTSEFADEHTRAAILRGGTAYQPQTSHWYFPQAYRLDQHGKLLLMAPCKDRSAGIGFRCVVDA